MELENLYYKIYKWENLVLAFRKARKGKTKKQYVIDFDENLVENLQDLQFELMTFTYKPKPLKTFILRDPKTRKISKSDFRDRVVHHAICNIIEPIFEKSFFIDNCANRKGKGTHFAIKRFDRYIGKVSNNNSNSCFILKADIKHYFQEVNHKILLRILSRKIKDEKVLWLVEQILSEREAAREVTKSKGMPLGNLTSQFFANVYLSELDYLAKHKLKAKYYIRYVDDFVLLHYSKEQLMIWKKEIEGFLENKLKLELHLDKTRTINLSRGIDFVGFRNFYYFKLLRKRSIRKMRMKTERFGEGRISSEKIKEIFQGWNAYAKWANSFRIRKKILNFLL